MAYLLVEAAYTPTARAIATYVLRDLQLKGLKPADCDARGNLSHPCWVCRATLPCACIFPCAQHQAESWWDVGIGDDGIVRAIIGMARMMMMRTVRVMTMLLCKSSGHNHAIVHLSSSM